MRISLVSETCVTAGNNSYYPWNIENREIFVYPNNIEGGRVWINISEKRIDYNSPNLPILRRDVCK